MPCESMPDRRRSIAQAFGKSKHLLQTAAFLGTGLDTIGYTPSRRPHTTAGPRNVTGLCNARKLKQPNVSHHLGLLRMGRLVEGTRKGKAVVYAANAVNLKALAAGLAKLTPRK
ncbi:MAG: helix-turn-helix transcriptional regulator [Chloroflexi bacterium]|nr:helix-turn-helix transcriptional regulator [Chloroflexota bacterium]